MYELYPAQAERLVPQSVEAEEALLGSLLIDPDVIRDVRNLVKPPHFFRQNHRVIYSAMLELDRRHAPGDIITVTDELTQMGVIEDVGGMASVSHLANLVPTSANAEHYARAILRTAIQRELLKLSSKLATLVYSDPDPLNTLTLAQRELRQIGAGMGDDDTTAAEDDMDRWYAETVAYMDARTLPGVRTGFEALDKHIVGLMAGELSAGVGRPGMSKSAWLLELATRLLAQGKRVVYVSLEMPTDQLIARLLASRSGIDTRRFRSRFLDEHGEPDVASFERVMEHYDEMRVLLKNKLRWRTIPTNDEKLRSMTLRLVERGQCDALLVDYLGLLKTADRQPSNYERVTALAKELKDIATEAHIPVVTLAQLNRASEGREDPRPRLSDLRDSGVIEEACDFVFGLFRPSYYDNARAREDKAFREYAELLILKARDGVAHATIPLKFTAHSTTYTDWPAWEPIPDKI